MARANGLVTDCSLAARVEVIAKLLQKRWLMRLPRCLDPRALAPFASPSAVDSSALEVSLEKVRV